MWMINPPGATLRTKELQKFPSHSRWTRNTCCISHLSLLPVFSFFWDFRTYFYICFSTIPHCKERLCPIWLIDTIKRLNSSSKRYSSMTLNFIHPTYPTVQLTVRLLLPILWAHQLQHFFFTHLSFKPISYVCRNPKSWHCLLPAPITSISSLMTMDGMGLFLSKATPRGVSKSNVLLQSN